MVNKILIDICKNATICPLKHLRKESYKLGVKCLDQYHSFICLLNMKLEPEAG